MLELNRLYLMDCMEGMAQFPDKYFELAIVDPPYGISAPMMNMGVGLHNSSTHASRGRTDTASREWDANTPTAEYFAELFRVSYNQVIFGGNYFRLPPTRGIGCWDKLTNWPSFSQWEMIWTSFDIPAFIVRQSNRGGCLDKGKIHPTQKPVALYRWLLKHYAKPGDKILDTHVGSASSLIACWERGHEYIGFELDPDYHAKATERIEAAQAQGRLFDTDNDNQPAQQLPLEL